MTEKSAYEKIIQFRVDMENLQKEKIAELSSLLKAYGEETPLPKNDYGRDESLYDVEYEANQAANLLGHKAWLTNRNGEFDFDLWVPSSLEC